jgi:glucose/arabinose dehydrogenase
MQCDDRGQLRINTNNPSAESAARYLNPNDLILPVGYRIEVYISGLDEPSSLTFTQNGDLYIAESGSLSGNSRVLRVRDGRVEVVASDFISPITGLNNINGDIYVSHKCNISVIKPDGSVQTVITGLRGNGDYGSSNVAFGNDGKIYWGQGTSTNSGVVGTDNEWVRSCPELCDLPGGYIILNGQNYGAQNILVNADEIVYTGAFSPFGVANREYEVRKGVIKASGSILRANLDGSDMELIAWGLRYPSHIGFDSNYHLFAANQGFEDRGSRPIINAPDEFLSIRKDVWYGWPDFAGGEPVTSSRFRPEGGVQPDFLFTNHPNIPPRPHAIFPPYSGLMGFDFNYNRYFGPYGDVYIAESGTDSASIDGDVTPFAGFGHRVSRIDITTRGITTFAMNKSGFPASVTGEGGFESPIDVRFGMDGALYVLDYGITALGNRRMYIHGSGVLWRIIRE